MCNYNECRTWYDDCCEAWKPKEKETNMVEVVQKLEANLKKIKEIDMKVIGNIDSWLTDIYEQPSRFTSELYSDSDQSMYAKQTLEILDIIKELMRQ